MTYVPDDIEIRRNALALHKAWREAEAAAADEDDVSLPPEAHERLIALRRDYYDKRDALSDEHDKAVMAVRAEYESSPLKAAAQLAESAYEAAPGPALNETYQGDAMICAASGVPIWDTDEIVEDPDTSEVFLRAALGLPPRPVVEEDAEDLEEAA